MRKMLVLAVVAGLITGLVGGGVADAAKKKKKKTRKVTLEYVCPCVGLFQFGSATGGDPNLGGGVITIGSREKFLSAKATDASGMPVPVNIQQDTDGDGTNNAVGDFCGETETPMPINPGLEVRVFVGLPLSCPTPSVLLGGTIEFVLSNKP